MSRSKHTITLLGALFVLFASTQIVHAWSFLAGTLNSPYNQCKTCHISNSNLALNPYGSDYFDPTQAAAFARVHNGDMANCNGCHAGYPHKRAGLANMDSDLDLFTNQQEFNAGTFPGDATDFPRDINPPVVTAFSLPATSITLTVSVTSFTAADDVAVAGYLLTETNTPPAAGDPGWSVTAPTLYTFATAAVHDLYAWAKDAAGNVSGSMSARVDTTPSSQRTNMPPMAAAGPDQTVMESDTVTLDGSGSTDDLGIISQTWVQISGPGGNPVAAGDSLAVTFAAGDTLSTTFMAPSVDANGATLTFRLTVTDGDNASASDEIQITVEDNGINIFDGIPGVISRMTGNGDPIGISAHGTNVCTRLDTLNAQDMPGSASQLESMIYGAVDFELRVSDPANTAVTVHFASPVPEGYKWYKYTNERGWFDFDRDLISGGNGEGAVFNADRTAISIYIDDNSEFDDNPATGLISDPGALAAGITPSTINVGSNNFSSAATGGGCFISSVFGNP